MQTVYTEALHFAENLTSIMEQQDLTKYRLAKMVPCSQSTVANWLNGVVPRGFMRIRLMEVLKVSEQELFGDNKNPDPTTEVEAEREEFIRLYQAAPAWLQDQVRSLLKAAEAGRASQDAGPRD